MPELPKNIKTAIIIGAGNVAWHLGNALQRRDIKIIQVIGRSLNSTQSLAVELNTEFTVDLNQIRKDADIYIVSVTDDAITDVIQNLNLPDSLIVHTSGSTPLSVFDGYFKNYGVLYPLQTFTKNRSIDFSLVPFFIEANSDKNLEKIYLLAKGISDRVVTADSATRLKLHIAAVFACNFTNYMYCLAEDILKKNNIDYSLLHPLILETALKALDMKPALAQTGPAVRKNRNVIKKHLEILENEPYLKKIYALLTESIQHKLVNE